MDFLADRTEFEFCAAKAEKELIFIHHTDILKGKEYWQEALERLQDNLPSIACG